MQPETEEGGAEVAAEAGGGSELGSDSKAFRAPRTNAKPWLSGEFGPWGVSEGFGHPMWDEPGTEEKARPWRSGRGTSRPKGS